MTEREREKERDKNSFKVGKYTRTHRGKRTIGNSSHNVEKLQLCETTIDIVHVGERIEHGTPKPTVCCSIFRARARPWRGQERIKNSWRSGAHLSSKWRRRVKQLLYGALRAKNASKERKRKEGRATDERREGLND